MQIQDFKLLDFEIQLLKWIEKHHQWWMRERSNSIRFLNKLYANTN